MGVVNVKQIWSAMFRWGSGLNRALVLLAVATVLAAAPAIGLAQTDEIQVYDAEIAEPGVINLMWHQNFTPNGIKEPAFPGAIISNHS
jgi:hypothetical protein